MGAGEGMLVLSRWPPAAWVDAMEQLIAKHAACVNCDIATTRANPASPF